MSDEDRLTYWKRRARDAERQVAAEERHNKHTTFWAQEAFREQRRLTDRLIHVYGVARSLGATDEQLSHPSTPENVDSPT